MKEYVVGVIGTGRIGKLHIANLVQLKNVRVKTAADPMADKKELQEWFKTSGVEHYVKDSNEIIEDSEIDVVFICSSTDTHLDLIEKSVEAGKHVFCEKPISFSQEETVALYDKIKDLDSKVMIGFNRRFDVNFSAIQQTASDGTLGEPHIIKITSRDPEAPSAVYSETSGGLFFDMTIHDFDMARFLANSEVTEVYAQGGALIDPSIEKYEDIDTAIITLKFENGAHGVIDNSRQAVYGYDQRAEVFGTKGQANTENETNTRVRISTVDGISEDKPKWFFLERYDAAFKAEIEYFFEAIENNLDISPDYSDGLKAQAIAFAAKKSYQTGKPVKVVYE